MVNESAGKCLDVTGGSVDLARVFQRRLSSIAGCFSAVPAVRMMLVVAMLEGDIVSAGKTEAALKSVSPEPILCWCYGQSLESRYSARGAGSGGAAGAIGASIGGAVLNRRLAKVRSANAVPMPPNHVVAVSVSRVFVFPGRVPREGPVATLRRDQVKAVHSGHLWHRLDLISTTGEGQRVHTAMAFGPGRGPRRLRQVIEELGHSGA